MSRALGAAFLTHQVEQLEKSVSASPPRNPYNHHPNTNSRDRHRSHTNPSSADSKRNQLPVGGIKFTTTTTTNNQSHQKEQRDRPPAVGGGPRKRGGDDAYARKGGAKEKDADVVVVDASVLVNALGQLKKWCRDGQEEVIIVPLEGLSVCHPRFDLPADLPCAPSVPMPIYPNGPDPPALNTLDLLKKGSTPLAQRARTASRMLESQVGTNPRVRVQQDAAFVLWDQIDFDTEPPPSSPSSTTPVVPSPSPEWVRRTICCAKWEASHADDARPRVVLATLAQSPPPASHTPQQGQGVSPVPLPL